MLSVYAQGPTGLVRLPHVPGEPLPAGALWIDLLEPTADEEKLVEETLGIDVPTREEMREIEASSRLYEEKDALFMTATIVTKLDTDLPQNAQVTFILVGQRCPGYMREADKSGWTLGVHAQHAAIRPEQRRRFENATLKRMG